MQLIACTKKLKPNGLKLKPFRRRCTRSMQQHRAGKARKPDREADATGIPTHSLRAKSNPPTRPASAWEPNSGSTLNLEKF